MAHIAYSLHVPKACNFLRASYDTTHFARWELQEALMEITTFQAAPQKK